MEVRFRENEVDVFDSKDTLKPGNDPLAQPMISLSIDAWRSVLLEVVGSAPVGTNDELAIEYNIDGTTWFRSVLSGTTLTFTPAEMDAFVSGVLASEFDPDLVLA